MHIAPRCEDKVETECQSQDRPFEDVAYVCYIRCRNMGPHEVVRNMSLHECGEHDMSTRRCYICMSALVCYMCMLHVLVCFEYVERDGEQFHVRTWVKLTVCWTCLTYVFEQVPTCTGPHVLTASSVSMSMLHMYVTCTDCLEDVACVCRLEYVTDSCCNMCRH